MTPMIWRVTLSNIRGRRPANCCGTAGRGGRLADSRICRGALHHMNGGSQYKGGNLWSDSVILGMQRRAGCCACQRRDLPGAASEIDWPRQRAPACDTGSLIVRRREWILHRLRRGSRCRHKNKSDGGIGQPSGAGLTFSSYLPSAY